MKRKMLLLLIIGVCISFFTTSITFAEVGEAMYEQQRKIDKYIFEDKKDELADMGITVTHTVALETTVEIGITPYTDENINYFKEAFGEDKVTIVEGQQAVTLTGNSEKASPLTDKTREENTETAKTNYYYTIAFFILAAGSIYVLQRKKRME